MSNSPDLMIRAATMADVPALCELAESARCFMAAHGNAKQWVNGYPSAADFSEDIAEGKSFVCVNVQGEIVGTFARFDYEPAYEVIDGAWRNDEPYVVLHRVATRSRQGIGTFILQHMMQLCCNLRIDTMETNYPMRSLLEKLGFKYCGVIVIPGHGERVAYHWTAEN